MSAAITERSVAAKRPREDDDENHDSDEVHERLDKLEESIDLSADEPGHVGEKTRRCFDISNIDSYLVVVNCDFFAEGIYCRRT